MYAGRLIRENVDVLFPYFVHEQVLTASRAVSPVTLTVGLRVGPGQG